MANGKVYLIGAGPGDPGLLTLKAHELLSSAEVVVYDRLVGEEIMAMIPPTATLINVGKHAGDHPVPQHRINEILVEEAQKGHQVIRLKGGDCFVFGRGGEELEELCRYDIPFEVVPGITSAIAAPAYAGIPVTHRDFCSSLHIITGHKQKDGLLNLDYDALVRLNGTLIFLMSVASVGEIAAGLLKAGMEPSTDCAVIENGTRPQQRKFVSSLETIEETVRRNEVQSPAIILVGRVCSLSDSFDWFDRLPLKGRRILVTRPKNAASRLADRLRALGAAVSLAPAIETLPLPFAVPDFSLYSALVFTSAAGVHAFFAGLFEHGFDSRRLSGCLLAAVGPQTAKALRHYGLCADFVPKEYTGSALGDELCKSGLLQEGKRVLIPRAAEAAPELTDHLQANHIAYDVLPVYHTVMTLSLPFAKEDFDVVTFTSASCVENFSHCLSGDLSQVTALCIGPKTAEKARELGMQVILSKEASIDSMIETLINRG